MAAAQLLATGSTALNSSDITVAAGAPLTVSLRDADATARVAILLKDEGGAYRKVGYLTASKPSANLSAVGVYRLSRPAGSYCGAFSATEASVGQIGGQIFTASTTLTVQAAAYSNGHCLGGKLTIANLARANDITGRITKLVLQSKALQTFAFDVVLFNADPSGSTLTDRSALDVVAADWDKVIGVIHVSDWTALGTTRSVAQALGLNIPFAPVSGARTLFAAIVVRSTPTPASTSDFKLLLSNDSD